MKVEITSADSTGFSAPAVGAATLFEDRLDAAAQLAERLRPELGADAVVVAISRGGVEIGAALARTLGTPLDVAIECKIRHPSSPERVLGAVAPGDAVYVRTDAGLTERQLARATEHARREAELLDGRLHADRARVEVVGRELALVDDGITTGARMVAAARWARAQRARRVVAAVPLAAADAAARIRTEVDGLVCLHELDHLGGVAVWYTEFAALDDEDVLRLLARRA